MMEEDKSILVSCVKQLQGNKNNLVFNLHFDSENAVFTITDNNNKKGRHIIPINEFYKLLNNMNSESIIATFFGKSYNNLLDRTGSKSPKLMV